MRHVLGLLHWLRMVLTISLVGVSLGTSIAQAKNDVEVPPGDQGKYSKIYRLEVRDSKGVINQTTEIRVIKGIAPVDAERISQARRLGEQFSLGILNEVPKHQDLSRYDLYAHRRVITQVADLSRVSRVVNFDPIKMDKAAFEGAALGTEEIFLSQKTVTTGMTIGFGLIFTAIIAQIADYSAAHWLVYPGGLTAVAATIAKMLNDEKLHDRLVELTKKSALRPADVVYEINAYEDSFLEELVKHGYENFAAQLPRMAKLLNEVLSSDRVVFPLGVDISVYIEAFKELKNWVDNRISLCQERKELETLETMASLIAQGLGNIGKPPEFENWDPDLSKIGAFQTILRELNLLFVSLDKPADVFFTDILARFKRPASNCLASFAPSEQ